jgi:hypothetical protein
MGYINSEAFYRLINVGAGAHPHNYPIGIAFYGGFSALAVFLSEYVYIFKNYKTTMSKRTKVIFWSIISFLVMGITDVCLMAALFHPMLILFEYKCINDEKA